MRGLGVMTGAALLAAAGPAWADDSARFGLACTGTEILRIASEPGRKEKFAITLSIDLEKKLYCYGACAREQTYPIADAASSPIMLTNLSTPQQSRQTTFNRAHMKLTDEQQTNGGIGPIIRRASASCKPAPFVAPSQP